MAKDAKPAPENVEIVAPKKSKKMLILIAAALVLILIIGGGAAFFLMRSHPAAEGEDPEATAETTKAVKKKGAKELAPVYVALDAFTVNLVPENGEQFLQLALTVEVDNIKIGDQLKNYTPKLRNNVMLLLSGKKASELISKDGKETLANEIRDLMNEVLNMGEKGVEGPVKEVLFTSFIIQ